MADSSFPARRLAIVVSHPVQYYAPWFAYLTKHLGYHLRVFYLWDAGAKPRHDPGFGREVQWDLDLLTGYDSCFVPNRAKSPGTHHFNGLRNPTLVRSLLDWQPDAILLFGYRYWSHLQVITSPELRHIPLLFRGDSHLLGENHGPLAKLVKRISLRIVFRRFAAFLSVGTANTAYFQKHGVPLARIFSSPHAIDNARFMADPVETLEKARSWRRELGIPESHRIILFAGKFESKKRPDDLIPAFLEARLSGVTLLLVGNGPLDSELRRLANGHVNIRFASFQNQSEMPRVYCAADVVVLPSCGPDETWGMVINEALCCGKPVIVSNQVGCHFDLVHPHRNGLIFPAGNREALAAALREALSDPARLKSWGEEGRRIISKFSYRETTAGLKLALTHVLHRRAPRRIHLWVPELSEVGGIQHYSRTLLRGLAESLPQAEIRVLSKNDREDSLFIAERISHRAAGRPNALRTLRFCALLITQTLTQRPSLAILTHLHFAPLAYVLKRLTGLRYWVAAHGIEAWGTLSPRMRKALAGAERILPVSHHTQRRLKAQGFDSARFFILPNAVDEREFSVDAKPPHLLRRYGLTRDQKVLFTLARLDPRERTKGYDLVLDAMPRVRETVPEVHYVLAGHGEDSVRIRRRIHHLGLEKHVTLTGFLPTRDLRAHYNLCDLFVMPGRSEGFGIVYLEALASGLPVLAGNQDGSREPLLEGDLGALVDPFDSGKLADTLVDLLLCRHSQSKLYEPAYLRSRMVERFGFTAFKERLGILLNS